MNLIQSKSPIGGCSDGGMYRGRTDDVMKLLMIGFEGLYHFCNPSTPEGEWHAIGVQNWSRFLN